MRQLEQRVPSLFLAGCVKSGRITVKVGLQNIVVDNSVEFRLEKKPGGQKESCEGEGVGEAYPILATMAKAACVLINQISALALCIP